MLATPVPARSNERLAWLGASGPALALGVAAAAAMLAAVHVIAPASRPERILDAVLPLSPDEPPAFGALLGIVALVAVAIGLRRGKRLSWELAVVVFGSAAFVQGVLVHHPIAATIAVGCLVMLVANRDRFSIRMGRPGRRIAALAVLAVLAAAGDMALALTFPTARASAATGLATATGTLADVFSFSSVRPLAGLARHDGLLTGPLCAPACPARGAERGRGGAGRRHLP